MGQNSLFIRDSDHEDVLRISIRTLRAVLNDPLSTPIDFFTSIGIRIKMWVNFRSGRRFRFNNLKFIRHDNPDIRRDTITMEYHRPDMT